MTHNPLNIDFAAITHAAERRTQTLKAISTLIAGNATDVINGLQCALGFYEVLKVHMDALDREGKDLLPDIVKTCLGDITGDISRIKSVLGAQGQYDKYDGAIDFKQFAIDALRPPEPVMTPVPEHHTSEGVFSIGWFPAHAKTVAAGYPDGAWYAGRPGTVMTYGSSPTHAYTEWVRVNGFEQA